jgi:glycerophosphoryl diester phosphodiesterase
MRILTKLAVPAITAAATLALAPGAYAGPAPDAVDIANVAHRGASAKAPENTLAAFREGIAMKSDLIETDVQRSKDGVLVLMHDTTLSRTTDVEQVFPDRSPWRVADFTYAEMRRLDAGSWKSAEYAGEPVPTLAQAVETIRPSRSGFLLEIKAPQLYPGIEAEVAEQFRAFPGYVESAVAAGRLVVQSFSFDSMRRYDAVQPEVPVGLLGTPSVDQLPSLAEFAEQVNPHHKSIEASYVDAVHAAGMECLVWTVDAPADMNRAADLGVDGIITNKPDVLDDVLRARPTASSPAA